MLLSEVAEDAVADELHEVGDAGAPGQVVVVEGVQDYAAVDVDVFAKGVVLQCKTGVDHGRTNVLLLLFRLLSEESLVQLEVLQR